jgi:hypothetical protein
MWEMAKKLKCNPDDLLDAACLAVTAALAADGMCETIPAEPEQDENGLYMKLTIPKRIIGAPASGQKVAVNTGIREIPNAIVCYVICGALMGLVGFLNAVV